MHIRKQQNNRDRIYSFLIPWLMDGGIVYLQTAMPLLAVRLGASAFLLGSIGWIAQAFRLPMCLVSGYLSERIGRTKIIVPAAISFAVGCLLMSFAQSAWHVLPFYVIAMSSIGSFYAPLQAFIGDVSKSEELRRNLGAFNMGWCTGSAAAALFTPALVCLGLNITLYVGTFASLLAASLVLSWQRNPKHELANNTSAQHSQPTNHSSLLLIARIGHFLSYYGYSTIRILFPKYAISGLGWTEVAVTWVTAQHLVGLSLGIIVASASGWWRGKLWPILGAQLIMTGAAGAAALTRIPPLFALTFFAFGIAQSIVYTAALYYSISGTGKRGKNTGIHESLVAAGGISGCLIGGLVADKIGLAAPLKVLSLLGCLGMIAMLAVRKLCKHS
ncbi:MAG: MFS transporter [Armatimonadota bacterium]